MTAGAWRFRASPRGRWRHRPRVGARAPRHREAEQPAQGHTASDPGFVAIALRVALVGHSSSSSSCGEFVSATLPSGHSPEAWSSPSPARRGGAAGRGAHPEADGGCAEASRQWAGGGGRPWPPPPGATVGGPTWNAPPSVPQVPVLRVLLSADLSCLQHFATLEEAGGSRQSHGGRAGTAQQAHSPQAQTRTWDRTPGDGRVRRSICEWGARGRWGGVCVVGPLVPGSGFLGLRVFI